MHCKHPLVLLVLLLAMLANVAGCARGKSDYAAHNTASPSSTPTALLSPTPKQITPANLAKLHWIEGTWRGTGGDVPPFYERYKFENDSTLVVETLTDETFWSAGRLKSSKQLIATARVSGVASEHANSGLRFLVNFYPRLLRVCPHERRT